MSNFALILFCFILGVLLKKAKIFPDNASHVLNRFVIFISLPALTLKEVHKINIKTEHILYISMAWLLLAFGYLFYKLFNKYFFKFSERTVGNLLLTSCFGNTSFVGFPLLEALIGPTAIATGILIDQPGTFLALGSLGVVIACSYSAKRPSMSLVLKKVLLFPPFQAVVLAILTYSVDFHPDFENLLTKLSATLIPLALVAVGAQVDLSKEKIKSEWQPLAVGLFFKLFLSTMLFYTLYVGILGKHGTDIRIVLLESAMAPMITSSVLASEYNLNKELSSLMLGVGIPLSLLTVPMWNQIFIYLQV